MPVKQKYSEHVIDIIEMEDIQTESDCNSEDSDTQHLGTLPDLNGTIEGVSLDEANNFHGRFYFKLRRSV